jgi:uncharacterized protein (TIGR00730 family)
VQDALWDIDAIGREIALAERALEGIGPAISMFGSSRIDTQDPLCEQAYELARDLSRAGYAIITGGGPGLMDAFNRGARAGGSASIGLSIRLPFETQPNPHLDIGLHFERLFTRKATFVRYSQAFVAMPGGLGTLDEIFEVLCLMSTGKAARVPVILVGDGYWDSLMRWLEASPVRLGMIEPAQLGVLHRADTAAEVLAIFDSDRR